MTSSISGTGSQEIVILAHSHCKTREAPDTKKALELLYPGRKVTIFLITDCGDEPEVEKFLAQKTIEKCNHFVMTTRAGGGHHVFGFEGAFSTKLYRLLKNIENLDIEHFIVADSLGGTSGYQLPSSQGEEAHGFFSATRNLFHDYKTGICTLTRLDDHTSTSKNDGTPRTLTFSTNDKKPGVISTLFAKIGQFFKS